ncbi:MAG: histidine kinase [Flavipsychrobacter sp.]
MPGLRLKRRIPIIIGKHKKSLGNSQLRYFPYIFITVISITTAVLRYYLLPSWGVGWHVLMLLGQFVSLTAFWYLIRYINSKLNEWYPFERGPIKRMALQNLITIMVIGTLDLTVTTLLKTLMPEGVQHDLIRNKPFMALMIIVFFIVVFMFNFAFYTYHFFEHWQKTNDEKAGLEIQTAELEKEKAQVQYHQLKNQVNPHYLFNTLTSLDGLIHTNPELASDFVQHMAKVYRYVLQHKESEVVNVYEELEFIQHYIELLQIRYGDGIEITKNVSDEAQDRCVVMVTLQMLIDNAIKHNIVQASEPLRVAIWDEGDYLIVHNNKQLRKQIATSNGTGLLQLKDLYSYLTDEDIVIEENRTDYTIKIPLL